MAIGTPAVIGSNSGTTGASLVITTSVSAAAGTTIFVAMSLRDSAGTANPACTDSAGNTYVRDAFHGVNPYVVFFRCSNCAALGSGGTITISGLSASADQTRIAAACTVSGLDLTSPLDQANNANGNSQTPSSGNITTTTAAQILLGACAISVADDLHTVTEDADYTNIFNAKSAGSTQRHLVFGRRIVSSTETNNYAPTIAVSSLLWVSRVGSYKEASAAGVTGTGAVTFDGFTAAATGTASEASAVPGTGAVTFDGFTAAAAGANANFFDDFDTSSMVVASSTITGVGDAAVFSMQPRNILTVAAPASARWLNIIGELRGGIANLTPIIEFKDYALWHPKINATNWASTKRIWKSVWDHATSTWGPWVQFGGAPTVSASTVRYVDGSTFGSYRIRLATTIPFSIEEDENFVAALASSYPAAIKNALSNTSGFRSLLYSSQTTDLSEATGAEYSLSLLIDDDNQTNPSGAKLDFSVNAGVHGNEFQGKRMWRAFITRLMQAETKANYLRSVYRFHARPSLNPIGGDHGQWRGDWSIAPGETTQTTDLNRAATDNEPSNQLITHFQTLNSQDYAGRSKIAAMLDFHGDFGIAHTKFVAFYNTDEYPAIDFLRDRMEGYLGAGFIHDYGPSSNDSVEHAHRTVWGAPLALTFELTEISPRSDADFASVADALVQSLYDMVLAGELDAVIGTGAITMGNFTAAAVGTASEAVIGTGGGIIPLRRRRRL